MAKDALTIEVPAPGSVGVRTIRISSPDRVMWPAGEFGTAVTKGDLARYFVAVGARMMPLVKDRPITLQRFPGGIGGEEFYSKNPPRGVPDWAHTAICTYPSGRRHPQLLADELATLIWAVQMNTVTFHPWPVTATDAPDALDNPDEVRIDLDPQPGLGLADALAAARELRAVMAEAGLTAYLKTSGNRGVHVFARIAPEHEFLDVRHGVIAIARELERRLPRRVTTAWWKEQRGERVFVDFNQANRDRTLAAAYSPRPLPGAPVSMPLAWDEVGDPDRLRSTDFTVPRLPATLADTPDPWATLPADVGSLDVALGWWEQDVADGLPELNFPPDYPKMPGEPPRVQPSRQRFADDEYDTAEGGYLREQPDGGYTPLPGHRSWPAGPTGPRGRNRK